MNAHIDLKKYYNDKLTNQQKTPQYNIPYLTHYNNLASEKLQQLTDFMENNIEFYFFFSSTLQKNDSTRMYSQTLN